jgi:hypothetical protein
MPHPTQEGTHLMAATVTRFPVREAPAAPADFTTQFARDLVDANPSGAAKLTAALLNALDASVAAILKASSP